MRTAPDVLDHEARVAFADVCTSLDLPVRRDQHDLFTLDVDGRPVTLAIHGATVVTPERVDSLTRRPSPPTAVPFVVADKVLGDARRSLDSVGWGWLDRRGRFHLRSGGALIDVDIEAIPRSAPRRRPSAALASRGAQELALALLLDPDDPPGVRAIARESGFAPSTISRTLAELRDLGLVRADGRPVIPDLFTVLGEQWAPRWTPLARRIDPTDPHLLEIGIDVRDTSGAGAAAGDTRAALAWGAPAVASSDAGLSLYVPDRDAADRILERWGRADPPSGGVDRIAIAPVPSVVVHRFVRPSEAWPVVHPVVAALDLAADRARGHQILDAWTPEEQRRVW